ncbi:50S ribosomal protein L19 [Phycomyces blakesleeanus]
MEFVDSQLISQANADGRQELFARKNPQGVKPGSILLVETLNSTADKSTSTFMGVCIAIRRKGIDSSFTLRNIVMRVGVEQRFSLYSPLVKSIRILQKPTDLKFRRAKLFYLRDQPGKAFQPLQGLWKQEQLDKAAAVAKK